ncbi:glycosyltransferase family 4 protein [Mitsuaria sp. WAJ17]|uniref:glycosyltransferase family 4 protein n=1 Tax=Mitsuaria sp. WAJ17 TaxID=2761452 RepID=UPI00160320D5|nr:glycosyltransferase family 4 protein [Mitsuaria sp. WAJ17]MBB2487065.1 glycosyltransferase family 4 protein [Mitsuaria sp. WAJ17]
MSTPAKMAYLVSLYPAVSHTFILREIRLLRELGHEVVTASVNRPPNQALGAQERSELRHTFFIKAQGLGGALSALLYWLLRAPHRLLVMLCMAPGLGTRGRRSLGLAYGLEAAILARWMQQQGTQLLHVHFGNAAASVGLLTRCLTRCHLSCTIHGPDEFDDVAGQHLARKVAGADAIVCISQHARAQLMRIAAPQHWHKLTVCRLGVDTRDFSFSVPVRGPVARLLCVGRLAPAKAQIVLLQALALLRDRGVPCQLTLVGDGVDRARIEATVEQLGLAPLVRMTGALPQAGVRKAMAQADIFVLPSLAEGIPIVLMEAMASGLPCVSTPVNGIPELISAPQQGLLATPGDPLSLAAHLQQLIQDPALCRTIALAALDKLQQDFELRRNVQQLSRLFRSFRLPPHAPVLPASPQTRGVA